MNDKIKMLSNDKDSIYITWNIHPDADYYALVGMDSLFVNTTIQQTTEHFLSIQKSEIQSFIKICICGFKKSDSISHDVIISQTDYLNIDDLSYTNIEIHSISSYEGITMSFWSEELYDKYYLYEKINDNYQIVLDTEDFQVTSKLIQENHEYYVDAFKKENNEYVLKAKSDLYICNPELITDNYNKKISVIIPAFNSELYLSRCVDSVLLSNFQDYEIILVNDQSTDKTLELMKWYKKKYKKRITICDSEKKGPSYARNVGIQKAKGEYIAFIDSDDMVHPFMYKNLYEYADKNNLDACIGKVLIRKDIDDAELYLNIRKDKEKDAIIYTFEDLIKEDEKKTYDNIFFVSPCNKIVKTSIVKKHLFPDFNYYEDTAFTMALYSYIPQFGFHKKAYYMWDKRFRKTVGTYTTSYDNVGPILLNLYYVNALFHVSKEGNPEQLKYLSYYSIREIYNFLKSAKYNLYNNKFAWAYIKEIHELNRRISLLNNPYIQFNKSIYSFVEKILKYRTL